MELCDPEGVTRGLFANSREAAMGGDLPSAARGYFERVGSLKGVSGGASFRLFYQPFRVTTAQALTGHAVNVAQLAPLVIGSGAVDIGCIRSDAASFALTAVIPLRAGQSLPAKGRSLLRLQRHLSGAFAQRVQPAWGRPALVLDSSGRAVHCNLKRPPPQLRELRSLVARELEQRAAPDEQAERLWDELWSKGWSVASIDDSDGRRYLVLRRARAEQP
jgi:hypothetical protein